MGKNRNEKKPRGKQMAADHTPVVEENPNQAHNVVKEGKGPNTKR